MRRREGRRKISVQREMKGGKVEQKGRRKGK
jgi:hypothetical protein